MPVNPTSPKLGLTLLVASQSQPEVLVDNAIRVLEAFAGTLSVKSMANTAPPGSPADGDCYIPAIPSTGAWAGEDQTVAVFLGSTGTWFFVSPWPGLEAYVQNEDMYIRWNTVGSPSGWIAR